MTGARTTVGLESNRPTPAKTRHQQTASFAPARRACAGLRAVAGRQGDASAAKSLAGYLSLQHVRHPEQGCPLPSLTPEIARADDAAKAAYEAGLLEIHAKLRRLTATSEDAWTLMAQNVGAVMLSRAIPDEKLQREILAALRQAGEKLLADSSSRSISSRA